MPVGTRSKSQPAQVTLPAPKVTLFRSEDVEIGWKGNVPVGTGLINMGNSCYINATLQVRSIHWKYDFKATHVPNIFPFAGTVSCSFICKLAY